jgi:hypothetical protein
VNSIPRTIGGPAKTRHQVRTLNLRVDDIPGVGLRISMATARGWAGVARTPQELARVVQQAFTEAQVAAYAKWRGVGYDLSQVTDAVPGDPLAPPRPRRPARRNRREEGWGAGQRRPDVHLPTEWEEQADGRWRSPAGRMYRPDSAMVVRVRAKLAQMTPPNVAA